MADVSQLITLGIGTPADLAHLILFGLSPATVAVLAPTADFIVRIPADDLVVMVPA